jgi:dTDP-4-amino-4,6-dideoxygalactose transaminase
LATQAREPAPHYEHREVGYNYRLSNLLAALGRSQLADLGRRVARRRDHNQAYREAFAGLAGVGFMPELLGAESTFWLTCLTVEPSDAGVDRDQIRLHLESLDIEARPVWKPMHLQPIFAESQVFGGKVSEQLFTNGLCLPSGSTLSQEDRDQVITAVTEVFSKA